MVQKPAETLARTTTLSSHRTHSEIALERITPMNVFTNALEHPRTSAAGVLIAIVSITGVLSQQGITLGKAGTGSVVSLLTAMASALLGLLARDPGAEQAPARVQKNQQ
jgi:hypothetical protein